MDEKAEYKQVFQTAINMLATDKEISSVVAYLQAATARWRDGVYNFTAVNEAHHSQNRELFILELAKLLAQ